MPDTSDEKPKEKYTAFPYTIVCKQCRRSFAVPIKLPVMMCPWCDTPNFS